MEAFNPNTLPDCLKQYYKRLFPFDLFYRWLGHGDPNYFQRREFAFVLENDAYLRFKSFNNALELEKNIQQLLPVRIEIGAVYNYKPRDGRSKQDFMAVERELVFDIDLNDYDDVRRCCTKDSMCNKCWQFMTIAVKIIDTALREDFGFDHRLWVYSGRRGIHCWVCDKAARLLTQDARSAVIDYLTLISGGENKTKKVVLPKDSEFLHPSVSRAVDIILQHFPVLAEGQEWFDDADAYNGVLALFCDEDLEEAVRKDFEKRPDTVQRAEAVVARLRNMGYAGVNKPLTETVLQYAYPRLDVGVTKTVNHLLKSPFSIHPKTGKVCVPLQGTAIDRFDLGGVPRVDHLYQELLAFRGQTSTAGESEMTPIRISPDYKRTSMASHIRVFEDFLNQLCGEKSSDGIEEMDVDPRQT